MFQGLGAVCTDAEWNVNPDDCERRNLEDYGSRDPMIIGPATLPRTAADLKAKIQQAGGALYVWSANVNQSPELNIVKANPLTFKATAVANDPGTYKITLSSSVSSLVSALSPKATTPAGTKPQPTSDLSSYLPYIVLAGGALVLFSLLKR